MNISHISYVFILIPLLLLYIYIFLPYNKSFNIIKNIVMKKLSTFSALALAFLMTSCKSTQAPTDFQAFMAYQQMMQQNQQQNMQNQQQSTNQKNQSLIDNEMGVELKQDICEIMAEEQPGRRASGNGQHFRLANAKNIAALQARAELAASMNTLIINSLRDGAAQDEQYAANDSIAQKVYDGLGVSEQDIKALINGVVQNTVIIKTSKYIKPNKQYNVYVCIEYSDEPAKIAAKISSQIEQLIPDNKKKELKERLDQLPTNIQNGINKTTKY